MFQGYGASIIVTPLVAAFSLTAAETPLTIEQLLTQGWEIAGYASGYDNRTSLILFRHPGENKLVQCGILSSVTRRRMAAMADAGLIDVQTLRWRRV